MSTTGQRHRLDGLLHSDNLLAFLALLGLLRSLEDAAPAWLPRVAWSVDAPPVRPVLSLAEGVERGHGRDHRGGRPEQARGAA